MAMSLTGPSIMKFGAANHSFGGPVMVSKLWYTGNTSAGGRAVLKSGTVSVAWDCWLPAAKDYRETYFDPPRRFTNLILATLSNGGAVYGEIA